MNRSLIKYLLYNFTFKPVLYRFYKTQNEKSHPRYLDNLRKSVPKLKGTVPNFGLPKWKRLPLESKIPMIPGLQKNVYSLTRKKLGEPLRVRLRCVDRKPFDTSDPYNIEVPLSYEGMHDKHLTQYFEKPSVRNLILKAGLVTSQMDVKCSLKDYNNYRNYLRVMYGKMILEKLDEEDEIYREKMYLNMADNQTLKKVERLKKDEIRDNLYKEIIEKKNQRIEEMLKKNKEKDAKIEILNGKKHQLVENKKMKLQKKLDYIKLKRAIMTKKEEQNILNTRKKWHQRDTLLRKTLEQNIMKKHCDKVTSALNRFEQKKTVQEEQMQKEIIAKECAEKIKQEFLKKYQRRIDKSQRKLQELLYIKKEAIKKSLELKHKKNLDEKDVCHCKRVKH